MPRWLRLTRGAHGARDFSGMKINTPHNDNERGALGWILLWVLGIPIPILIIFFLIRGCT